MKIQDCILNVDQVVSAPLIRRDPEANWLQAKASKNIPDSLFEFYEKANYFSLFAPPLFLKDSKNILFSYLEAMTVGIKRSLIESQNLVSEISELDAHIYSPIKKARGESWDPEAGTKQDHCFKNLVIDLYSSLDLLSEIFGVFYQEQIDKITVGRAEFSSVYNLFTRPFNESDFDEKYRKHLKLLYTKLGPQFNSEGDEKDWYKYFRLLRHKLTHLGTSIFHKVLLHDKVGRFFAFLPNHWPYLPQEYISIGDGAGQKDITGFLLDKLIHQDLVSFSRSLKRKIYRVHSIAFEILIHSYSEFENQPLHQKALNELRGNYQNFDFKCFGN